MTQSSLAIRRTWFVDLAVMLVAVVLASNLFQTVDGAVLLFGRWDVLACSCLAAFPLVVLLTSYMTTLSCLRKLVIGGACLAAAVAAIALFQSFNISGTAEFACLALMRGVVATAITLAVVITCSLFSSDVRPLPFLSRSWWTMAMLAAFALFVPASYVDAVADGIRIDLENSLGARRYALAAHQAHTLMELKPSGSVHGKALVELLPELRQTVDDLESDLGRPLPPHAPIGQIARRITLLMHLDRFEEALRLLNPLRRDARFQPICLDYQGLCWQRLQQYPESLDAYQNAVAYWNTQPDSDRKRVSLASAWKGIGFAARHLGHRTLEENAYRTLVDLSPTAENHFLLAQCYSEHQKTRLAAEHSTIAVQLDPKLRVQSESMVTSMSRDHFGCLQIP